MLNLGNITFGLAVDTSGLDKGARVLEGFGQRVDRAMAGAAKGVEYNTRALQKQEGAAIRAMQQVQQMAAKVQNSKLDPQVKLDNLQRLSTAYDTLVAKMATPINRTLDPLAFQRSQLGFKEQVDAVNRALTQTQATAKTVGNDVSSAFNKQMMAADKARASVASLNDQISRALSSGAINSKTADALQARANTASTGFGNQMQQVGMDPRQMLAANLQLKNSLMSVQRDLKASTSAVRPLQAAFHGLSDSAAMVIGPLNGVVFRLRASHDMMERYGMVVGGTAAALSGLAVSMLGLGSEILRTEIAYQKADVTLTGLLRSTAMADAELTFLRKTAMDAGLAFNHLAPQFSRFVSAAQGSNQGLSETNEQFRQMAMLSGTLHLTTDEVNRVLLAFDQMLSAGRIMGDDMRQLRNVLPAAYEAAGQAAEKMGTKFRDASGKISDLNPSEFIGNLLDVYMEMFNIDLNAPIDTLQADLGRLQGSWEQMILAISSGIGASEGFQAVFDGLGNALLWMSENIDIVLATVGGLTGALTGLFAVMVAGQVIAATTALWGALNVVVGLGTTLFVTARTALVGLQVAEVGAMLTTAQLTAAQTGLNVAMTANPIGIVIKGLAVLAGVLFGAKLAYDAMNQSVATNQAQMADMTSIDAYIAKMKEKGKNIREVTVALRAQVTEHMNLALQEQRTAMAEMIRLRGKLDDLGPAGSALASPAALGSALLHGGADNARLHYEQALKVQSDLVNEYARQQAELHGRGSALTGLGSNPEDNGAGSGNDMADRNSNRRQADADRGLRAINDIINRSKTATILLDNMWRGPTHSGLVDAIDEVNRRLFDMDPDQLARMLSMFNNAGIPVEALGGISDALAVVTLRAQAAEDTVKRFNDVWDDIQKGTQELAAMNRELEFIVSGGDHSQLFLVEALNKAKDTIRELTTQDLPGLRDTLANLTDPTGNKIFNDAAVEAIASKYESSSAAGLEALQRALLSVGYSGDTAEEALTSFYAAIGRGNQHLSAARTFFSDFNAQVQGFHNTMESLAAASGGASLDQLINLDYLQQAAEATRGLGETAIGGLIDQLQAMGMAGNSVNEMLANFYRAQADVQRQSDEFRAALESQTAAWVSFGTNSVDAIYGVLTGAQDLKTGVLSILADLAQTILNAAIFDPLKQQLSSVITDMVNGREGVGFGDIVNVFGRAGNRFLGGGGGVNGAGGGEGEDVASTALNLFAEATRSGANALNIDFLSSIFKTTVGTTSEAAAKQINILTLNASTSALIAFTAAIASAAATAAASGASDVISTVAAVGFAEGGQIFGPGGTKGDKIPAMLSDQEFVVNADATQKNLKLLHAINRGAKVRMFADGGQVTPDMAVGHNGGPEKSGLTNSRGSTKIVDARTTLVVNGNVGDDQVAQLKRLLDQRDERLRNEIPYLIDERVVDSRLRGRI